MGIGLLSSCYSMVLTYSEGPLGIWSVKFVVKIKFIYIFSEWYKQPKYKDILEYILLKDCSYYYNEMPIQALGLDT